ncbi:CTLH/CRA C-terminal to lish motif domain-domain-containing protein [Tuber borchii]|uniref:CTLH/CRA C-terminal to lish motif domain-domain-containing protein n=1 Tax=Tuber borchii TaxID=42251 RepID=A0A2T6ZYH0_TUBBO|nr:CTLH/CRA C-terminal to lish motif domain-domain-containing protein [Tuber borchii]
MSMSTTKLNAESHLLLDQPLLRLPHELLRKTFKTSQKHFERDQNIILTGVKEAATKAMADGDPKDSIASLDSMINRMQGLKRKLESLHEDEKVLQEHSRKRISHLQDLYNIPSLVDEGYDRWSRTRLDRLLVDFLLRAGYGESAKKLAQEKQIEDLVDVDVFVQCARVEASLRKGSTMECLAWCQENKNSLRKMKSTLEFELRLQQFIELVRAGQPKEATAYSKKFLVPHSENHLKDIEKAAALLAFRPDTPWQPYKAMHSADRWEFLANTFVNTHHNLHGLPSRPLLHIALSAGLSALKTPSCHSAVASSSSNTASSTTSLCPICSTELNDLAKHVPYAHHVRSSVEPDPVVLPNGRIYGRERLEELASKLGLPEEKIRDPTTGEEWDRSTVRKVFIM